MSEQTTATPEQNDALTAAVESGSAASPLVPPPAPVVFAGDDDPEEEHAHEEEDSFTAPAQYVEREGSGRTRRIGSDVRYDEIDYKNIGLLSRFLDRRGRILSRRKTRVSAKVQRRIVREIKRARQLALLPYTADQTRIVRKRK